MDHRLLGLEHAKNKNLRCQKHTQRETEIKIYEIRQDTYVPGAEERDQYIIYIRLQEDFNWFSQELLRNQLTLKWVQILYLQGGEENPQNSSRSGRESHLT